MPSRPRKVRKPPRLVRRKGGVQEPERNTEPGTPNFQALLLLTESKDFPGWYLERSIEKIGTIYTR